MSIQWPLAPGRAEAWSNRHAGHGRLEDSIVELRVQGVGLGFRVTVRVYAGHGRLEDSGLVQVRVQVRV